MEKKYKSKYLADSDITPAQYLTEYIMERQAQKIGKTLPPKFWATPSYNKEFCRQISAANKLLKLYDMQSIMTALRHNKGKWITSLGATKQISEIIEKYVKNTLLEYGCTDIDEQTKREIFECDDTTLEIVRTKSLWEKLN